MSATRLRVLFLARAFPNPARNHIGQTVLGLARALGRYAGIEVRAASPLPWVPPLPVGGLWRALARVPVEREECGIRAYHPRQLVGIGQSLFRFEGETYLRAVRPVVERLVREWPFAALHAHYSYPDGYAAARLAEELGIPFFITERAFWRPWFGRYPAIGAKAAWAARRALRLIAVSESLLEDVVSFTGDRSNTAVVPNGVDAGTFRAGGASVAPGTHLLYVGWLTYHKGLDLLIRAMPTILRGEPEARLTVVGHNLYRSQRLQEREIRALAERLGVASRIRYLGALALADVADEMRRSTLLVSPSRREAFGAVVIEALASGLPVVATASGGPAEIVTAENGRVVPLEEPEALAEAVLDVIRHRDCFPADRLRAHALERFSWEVVAATAARLYREALAAGRTVTPVTGR